MKGTALATLLEGIAAWARSQDDVAPQELCPVPGVRVVVGEPKRPTVERGRGARGGMTNAEKCAARRANRAAERAAATPLPTPPSGVRGDPERDPTTPRVTPAPTPVDPTSTPLPFRSGSSSSGGGSFSKTTTTTGSGAEPTPDATPLPTPVGDPGILARCAMCHAAILAGDHDVADDMRPHEWPELQARAERFRAATGQEHVVAGPLPNANTRRLVELFSHPFLPSSLDQALEFLPRSSWWKDPAHRTLGLAGLSPRVIERVLSEAQEAARPARAPAIRTPGPVKRPAPIGDELADIERARTSVLKPAAAGGGE